MKVLTWTSSTALDSGLLYRTVSVLHPGTLRQDRRVCLRRRHVSFPRSVPIYPHQIDAMIYPPSLLIKMDCFRTRFVCPLCARRGEFIMTLGTTLVSYQFETSRYEKCQMWSSLLLSVHGENRRGKLGEARVL